MTIKDIKPGKKYQARVGGKTTVVRVTEITEHTKGISRSLHKHIEAVNLSTGRHVTFRSAVRLVKEVAE